MYFASVDFSSVELPFCSGINFTSTIDLMLSRSQTSPHNPYLHTKYLTWWSSPPPKQVGLVLAGFAGEALDDVLASG